MKRSWIGRVAAVAVAFALAGCTDASSSGELALREALTSTAGRTEGQRFNPTPWPLAAATPHRLAIRGTLAIVLPAGPRTVELTRIIDRGPGGRFHVIDDRALLTPGQPTERYDDGREGIFEGARFVSRRRFGPWIEGDLLHGGHERMLRDAYALAPDLLAAFGDYLRWHEDPAADEVLAGIPVRWAAVSLDPRVAPRHLDAEAQVALRDDEKRWPVWLAATHRPTRVTGAIARSKATGEVVAGQVAWSGRARVEGVEAEFSASFEYTVKALPKDARFTLPEDTLSEARPRTWRMIEEVLGDDLNAVYRGR